MRLVPCAPPRCCHHRLSAHVPLSRCDPTRRRHQPFQGALRLATRDTRPRRPRRRRLQTRLLRELVWWGKKDEVLVRLCSLRWRTDSTNTPHTLDSVVRAIPSQGFQPQARDHVQPLARRAQPQMDESYVVVSVCVLSRMLETHGTDHPRFIGKTGGEIFHEMMLRHGVKHICESCVASTQRPSCGQRF